MIFSPPPFLPPSSAPFLLKFRPPPRGNSVHLPLPTIDWLHLGPTLSEGPSLLLCLTHARGQISFREPKTSEGRVKIGLDAAIIDSSQPGFAQIRPDTAAAASSPPCSPLCRCAHLSAGSNISSSATKHCRIVQIAIPKTSLNISAVTYAKKIIKSRGHQRPFKSLSMFSFMK